MVLFIIPTSCTKLDTKTYSVTPLDQFWQNDAQIAAGIAPAYAALQGCSNINGNVMEMIEPCTDEMVVPTRGGDWGDAGHWDALWFHRWTASGNFLDPSWQNIFSGVSKCNQIITVVNSLTPQPAEIVSIIAELKTLRAYYYYLAMDQFGNVPILTDTTTVANVPNSARAQVYSFIVTELKNSLPNLSAEVNSSTYGRATKYFSYALLARLALNAQVFSGTADWANAIKYCDSVMAGPYSLTTNYFDNFAPTNGPSVPENIFCIPFDATNITGNAPYQTTLHYNSQTEFGLAVQPWNGFCSTADYYAKFDTASTYKTSGADTRRSFNDLRTMQYLVGQQYDEPFSYSQFSGNSVLYSTTNTSLISIDNHTSPDTPLIFNPVVANFSDPSVTFHAAGVRNMKYFPDRGIGSNGESNDIVIFRLADIMLMKAEAELRLGTPGDALTLVNAVRTRAYQGNASYNWNASQLTLDNILDERARELSWEGVRRDDLIRYEVASGKPYWSAARTPGKAQDVMDGHLYIFPIPSVELTANSALKQNSGYQ